MPDMLVKLLSLPPLQPITSNAETARVVIRRALPFEISQVRSFIEQNFSVAWADETTVGFANKPISVFIAVADKEIVGFAAYECTCKGFFGPAGVTEQAQVAVSGKH